MIPYSVVIYLMAFAINFVSLIYVELNSPLAKKVSLAEVAIGFLMCGLPFLNVLIAVIHILGAILLLVKKVE